MNASSPWIVLGFISVGIGIITLIFKFGAWKGSLDTNLNTFNDFIKEMRGNIEKIFERLPPPKTTAPGSPINLTELGKTIAMELEIETWIDDHVNYLFARAQGKDRYQIQEMSFHYAREEFINKLKSFEHGLSVEKKIRLSAFKHGLDIKGVTDVVGVVIRDHLLDAKNMEAPE